MLIFRIISKCFQDATNRTDIDNDVDFLLEENDWDDFGYKTTYHLHITGKHSESGKPEYLGYIHIMQHNQSDFDTNLLRTHFSPSVDFYTLPDDFVSKTDCIDLFERVGKYLKTVEDKQEFVNALHIMLGEDKYYDLVKDDDCFEKSLCRASGLDNNILNYIKDILFNEGYPYNLREQSLTVSLPNVDNPVELSFKSVSIKDNPILPNGMVAFIGKNASGKSTALYRLAALMYASPSERTKLKHLGLIQPADIYIRQLMIFSYTPFDTFLLPGQGDISQLRQWVEKIELREGRFIYCGMRDVQCECNAMIDQHIEKQTECLDVYSPNICLKDVEQLAKESWVAYNILTFKDEARKEVWNEVANSLQQEGFEELFEIILRLDKCYGEDEWLETYNVLSTGHKFFLHTMLHIVAYIKTNALLLFDEPENHLQSPLLSFMMTHIRKILFQHTSVMLIATHSPVIVQELLSANVRIVRRSGNNAILQKPQIETFGESFGNITSEVFDMTTDRNTFFHTLDYLYDELGCKDMENPEEAIAAVKEIMHGLSDQAINYLVNRYFDKDVEN